MPANSTNAADLTRKGLLASCDTLEAAACGVITKALTRANIDERADPRWADIAELDIQKGFMALRRAIQKVDVPAPASARAQSSGPAS